MNRFTLALGIALAVVEVSLAIVLIETSDHEPHVGQTLALAVTAGVAFIVSGLVALWRRPENRTGIYLAAVGYLWFFGALSESNNGWLFAIGFVFGSLPWVPFAALLLTHPTGRFEHRLDRAFPWIVGITAVSLSATIALLAPTVPSCDGCPTNPLAVTDAPGAVRVLDAIDTASGIVLALAAVLLMTRRWRRASRALRRALWPVLATGAGALVTLIVSGVLAAAVSSSAGDALSPVFLVFFAAVPIAFLFGILRTRLARSSVSELVLALQAGAPLRSALGKSLGDPDLDVAYRLEARRGLAGAGWVDLEGRSVPAPVPDAGHSVRLVERDGELIAAIVHDRALDSEPELLDAVTAAAGLTLENDRLQAELRAEVSFITTVTNTAPSLLVNIDPDGRIRGMNAAALEASGHSDEEAIRGRHYWDLFIDPSEREAMIARFHALAPDFPPGEYENTFTNARGQERTIYWRAAPVKDAADRVLSIVSGGLDITERRKRELDLQRERDATTTALESIPSIAVVLDRDGVIRDRDVENPRVGANRAFRHALGWRDHELVGRPFLDLVAEDDPTPAQDAIASAAGGSASDEVESELRCADGSVRAFAWRAVPVADVTGRTQALVLVSGIEITERRRLELEKERERAFLNAIAENAPSMLCLVDETGRVSARGANRAFEEALGYAPDEIGGQVFWDAFVEPAEATEVRDVVLRVARGDEPREHDNTWLTSSGERVAVAWTCTPLPKIDERTLFLVTGLDVTVRKRMEADLRASRSRLVQAEDDARRALERNLHDGAQQRLVALSVALRLVESRIETDRDGAAELLSSARDELTHALAELRELARGIHPAVLTDRGLRPALDALAARAPIPVEVSAPAERLAPEVEAAAYYVVAESLTNVAKYAEATSARICVARDDGIVSVTVEDDGVGGADPLAGSGLRGLADRVAVLDGRLEVDSAPGTGTAVRASIPLPRGDVEPVAGGS